ncbi:MAG TPA: ABC transporter substrate-binding protein [Phycisphaerales bacterium]|nr:ABC transporter substrate-binding protein [Phycisphaerales bacterium]
MSSLAARLAPGLLLACSLFFACENKAPAPDTTTGGGTTNPPAASGDAIIIGHYGSLTGGQATFGKSTDNGIKLAIKEVNDAGGLNVGGVKRRVRLVSEDTEGKKEKAGNVVTKLVTNDKCVAVLGEVASSVSLAGAPVCQQYGVPMITPSSTNPDVTAIGDMIFRVCFIDPFQGQAAAKFMVNDLKKMKAAVLFDQASAYSVGLKDEFAKALVALGGQITGEQAYSEGAADFNAQLVRIREGGPDVIFVPGYYSDIAKIAIQARKLGLTQPLLGGDGWDSEELGKNAGEAIEGSFYTNHYAVDNPTPAITKFVADYKAQFGGSVPDGLAALGYDAAKVLFAAMEKTGSTDGKALRDAIAQTKDFPGVTGSITLNESRDAVKPAVVVERKGGQWVFRSQINP